MFPPSRIQDKGAAIILNVARDSDRRQETEGPPQTFKTSTHNSLSRSGLMAPSYTRGLDMQSYQVPRRLGARNIQRTV